MQSRRNYIIYDLVVNKNGKEFVQLPTSQGLMDVEKAFKDAISPYVDKIYFVSGKYNAIGKELLKLMIDYNVGVETREILELKKIDLDFFEDED